jgi:5,10-methylenetetrahydrofolate reductase
VPFLTSKHTLDYCLSYAERAWQHEFSSLVVLGGDKHVGPPRVFEHAWQLRQAIRAREPKLTLGGWANPNAQASGPVDYLLAHAFTAAYYLTQIVSHLHVKPVERFIQETRQRGIDMPGMFGVVYYRSAKPQTLATLGRFLPVPAEPLTESSMRARRPWRSARARSVRCDVGVRHFYVSNLPLGRAQTTLDSIVKTAGLDEPR